MSLRARPQSDSKSTDRLRHVLSVGMHNGTHHSTHEPEIPWLKKQTGFTNVWHPDPYANDEYIMRDPNNLAAFLIAKGAVVEVMNPEGTSYETPTPYNVSYYIWSKFWYDRVHHPAYGEWVMTHYNAIYALHPMLPLLPRRQRAFRG